MTITVTQEIIDSADRSYNSRSCLVATALQHAGFKNAAVGVSVYFLDIKNTAEGPKLLPEFVSEQISLFHRNEVVIQPFDFEIEVPA